MKRSPIVRKDSPPVATFAFKDPNRPGRAEGEVWMNRHGESFLWTGGRWIGVGEPIDLDTDTQIIKED